MATAAPSSLASSLEKTNGAKLSRLLIDGGTTVLRNAFDRYHPPVRLATGLNANYLTLKDLFKKKVLRSSQWDLLFPSGGAAPDSNKFDITLLFLLLTNICGLTPPPLGWHTKPSTSDSSFEALLAHVKFFRNELYGHVSSIGIDTLTFSTLWKDISAVLVSLGLDRVEIDKLKAEHGGEEDYIDLLREWSKSEENIKSELRDISNFQSKVYDDVKDVRGTQLEDHKTLADTKNTLEELSRCQTKTLVAVEEVQDGIRKFNHVAEDEKNRREAEREIEVLNNLAKAEFEVDIQYHAQRFQEGTREWIFKKVDEWLDNRSSPNRVMIISGNAGMGKSVISAVVCKRMQHAGRLSGSHFCQHNSVRYSSPQLMLQSLACHLTHTLSDYKKALVEKLSRNLGVELNSMGVEDLFALLFKEPLITVKDPQKNILMVVDGLDESEYQGRNELLGVVANQFCKLPTWIRFLVTTRPEINIAERLKHLQPIQLDENQEENERDIKLFFESRLESRIEEAHKNVLLKKLFERSEGVFLYAYFLVTCFKEENISLFTLKHLESKLPLGISSVYLSHFKRLEKELCEELKVEEEQVLNFLCALTASREPLPVSFACKVLKASGKSLAAQRRVNKAMVCISTLLPIRDGRLHFIHKSVKDWLTNTSSYCQHDFIVDRKEGHEILFKLCAAELDNIKRKEYFDSQFNDTENYALQHGVQHMIEVDGLGKGTTTHNVDSLVRAYVTDLKLIYAKLCVNSAVPSTDLLSILKKVKPALLKDESRSLLNDLSNLLRKHSHLISSHSHILFQSLVNEGSHELSSSATMILETELPNVSYLKYGHKEGQNGRVQARFYCSDTVACFDVSPEMDYMVCECRDGTIHLWSLQTGNKEWERPSLVKREFEDLFTEGGTTYYRGAYRRINYNGLTLYRSVAFDPSGKRVLPGNLKSVYTLNGDCDELFPESSCTFAHCVFPENKGTILTDCCDDPMKIGLWSLEDGQHKWSMSSGEIISSFTISNDESLLAIADVTGSIRLYDLETRCDRCLYRKEHVPCVLMHLNFEKSTLVCGYLPFKLEDLGHRFDWVYDGVAVFRFMPFQREDISNLSSPAATLPPRKLNIMSWPIEPGNLTLREVLILYYGIRKGVGNVFPSFLVGSYKKLSRETALVSSPSFPYLAAINVCRLDEETSDFRRKVIEVVLSREGDTIYSVTSDENSTFEVTVFRISNPDVLVSKPAFTSSSLSLLPMKEGVLCLKDGIPELWDFDLTRCIRPLPKLSGAEELSQVSQNLIACQRHCRKLSHEELVNFGQSSVLTDTLELSIATDECSVTDEVSGVDDSANSSESDDAISRDLSDVSMTPNLLMCVALGISQPLFVDVVDVCTGECVKSLKAWVEYHDKIQLVSCNSENQVLVCTFDEIEDRVFNGEELKVSLRNNNSWTSCWERSSRRYDDCPFVPHFAFSPEEDLVITWHSLSAGFGLHILDMRCGKTVLTLLKHRIDIVDCKFVCDSESLISCNEDNFVRLWNVRSGDLLCLLDIEEVPLTLGACLGNDLVVVGLSGARLKFIHAVLPRVKDSEKKKGRQGVHVDFLVATVLSVQLMTKVRNVLIKWGLDLLKHSIRLIFLPFPFSLSSVIVIIIVIQGDEHSRDQNCLH